MSELPITDHGDDHDACARALSQVQAFLHHELPEADADLIRAHLDACEQCLENYDIEQTIATLVKRCHPPTAASSELRMRIVKMSMTMRTREG
ncbi:zf-HC2 domain-containing protein [Luteococcus peritonei]|uniref:Zf-HC2 domain-containing protein n=1 Tax=Luteococcus peritonei TaxID=88874 RepID=A0ABW4RYP5_9ACTN